MTQITYKNETLVLSDEFVDVGYMAENFEVLNVDKKNFGVKRSHENHAMTVLLSFSSLSFEEIYKVDKFLSMVQVPIYCYAIFAHYDKNIADVQKDLERIEIVFDEYCEFKELYGTEIVKGTMVGDLCKAIFLISKDGAIFYIDILNDLEDSFDLERLQMELNKAYLIYTGVGCHG